MANGDDIDLSIDPSLRGNPFTPTGAPPVSPQQAGNFDISLGDSIAAQQVDHGMPGKKGKVFTGDKDQPFEPGATAAGNDTAARILQRAQFLHQNDPNFFQGKNIFLSIGSNSPKDLGSIQQLLGLLNQWGAGQVVVPGVGPKVIGSNPNFNTQLAGLVTAAGPNFHYYEPKLASGYDDERIHPRNPGEMYNQAAGVLHSVAPQVAGEPSEVPSYGGTFAPRGGTYAPPTQAPTADSDNQLRYGLPPVGEGQTSVAPTYQRPPWATGGTPTGKTYGQVVPYDAKNLLPAIGATPEQYNLWRSYLAQRESSSYAQPPNGDSHSPIALEGQTRQGFMGRYQMGSNEIIGAAKALGIQTPSQQEFLNNPQLQEQLFEQYTLQHHQELMNLPQYANGDARTRLSLLMGAHLGGTDAVVNYMNHGTDVVDANKTSVGNYINSSYNVLGDAGGGPLYSGQNVPGTQYGMGNPLSFVQPLPPQPVAPSPGGGAPGSTLPPVSVQAQPPGQGQPTGQDGTQATRDALAKSLQQGQGWQKLALAMSFLKPNVAPVINYNPGQVFQPSPVHFASNPVEDNIVGGGGGLSSMYMRFRPGSVPGYLFSQGG